MEQYEQYNIIDGTHFLPHSTYSECTARCINAYLIAPDGYLYKCWTDLGDPKETIGHISGCENNVDNLAKYMMGGDPLSDPICSECNFLPVCGGGCPHLKVKNIFAGTHAQLCHLSKSKINKLIEMYYEKNYSNN